MRVLALVAAVSCLVVLGGCSQGTETPKPVVPIKVNVARVLMHEPKCFTFLVRHGDGTVGQLTIFSRTAMVLLREDVPAGDTMWVEFTCNDTSREERSCDPVPIRFNSWDAWPVRTLTIHVHAVDQIAGAGWDHGKFGKGQTAVIE